MSPEQEKQDDTRVVKPADPSGGATAGENEPTREAVTKCGYWLAACLGYGWRKSDLDWLEALWWKCHDRHGRLIESPRPVPAVEPVAGASNQ